MKNLSKVIFIILCGVLLSLRDYDEKQILTPDQMKKDIAVLRSALEKSHPGIYWYTPKVEFDRSWDSLNLALDRSMTELQFLKIVLPVVAKVKCAHTLFFPSEKILAAGKRFPIDIKFLGGKGYLIPDSLNQYRISKGSELLAINGTSLTEIVRLLMPSLEAQGGNIGWKYVTLENDFQNYYYYVIDQPDDFEIEYIDHATRLHVKRKIAGTSENSSRHHWKNWYPKESGAPLSLRFFTNPDVALITIKSFHSGRYKQYGQDYDKLVDQYFKEIKGHGINNVIIDVRGNEGGNNPELVYSYIANTGDKNTDGKAIVSVANSFHGNVIVLANERSISAQESFVAIFKNNNRGLVIGQPTAGSYEGLCGGNKRRVVLPHSHFEIRIPLHASKRTYREPVQDVIGTGLSPDIKVDVTIEDFNAGKDATLEAALDKISTN